MNQTSKKQGINLRPGSVLRGKWHNNQYTVLSELGKGAIGSVYLCQFNGKKVALKISDKGSSVTMEVNVLKTFQKVQGNRLGPSLLDVDDWIDPRGKQYSFYVMEYLRGKQLSTFIKTNGEEWLGILMLQLLGDLESLHKEGWVFGDLKTENLIVTYPAPRIRWIDVGGTTQIGRSIKEYTEFYDRGYWNLGSRKAEPSYDLFALAMIMIQHYHPRRFERGSSPKKTLMHKLNTTPPLSKYQPIIKKALIGHYQSSAEMKKELSSILMKQPNRQESYHGPKANQPRTTPKQNKGQTNTRVIKKQTKQSAGAGHPLLESFAISIVVLLFYLFYLLLS